MVDRESHPRVAYCLGYTPTQFPSPKSTPIASPKWNQFRAKSHAHNAMIVRVHLLTAHPDDELTQKVNTSRNLEFDSKAARIEHAVQMNRVHPECMHFA